MDYELSCAILVYVRASACQHDDVRISSGDESGVVKVSW